MYDSQMLITLIVKIPIIKNFRAMKHHEVTELFRHHCQKVPGLYECFIAASDMMVSDWDGNQEENPLKYKCIYSKYVSTREVAVNQLMENIPRWFSMMDNHGGRRVPLYWGCSMQLGNHVHKPKNMKVKIEHQEVFIGDTNISNFQVPQDIDSAKPAAVASIPLTTGQAFVERARGNCTALVAKRATLTSKHTQAEFEAILLPYFYHAEFQALMQSPFAIYFAQFYWRTRLDLFQWYGTKELAAKAFPFNGLTLARAKVNFPPVGLRDFEGFSVLAQFSAGQICICNEVAIGCREEWNEHLGVLCDGPAISEKYIDEEGKDHGLATWPLGTTHMKNIGAFFEVNDENGFELLADGFGMIFQQHIQELTPH